MTNWIFLPLDAEPVEVDDRVRVSPVTFDAVSARRRLRRYVQIQGPGDSVPYAYAPHTPYAYAPYTPHAPYTPGRTA